MIHVFEKLLIPRFLYASQNLHFLYIITFLDSFLEGLQEFLALEQIISLEIGLDDYNQIGIKDHNHAHIIQELHTREQVCMNRFSVTKPKCATIQLSNHS